MAEIVNLAEWKAQKDEPDADCIRHDGFGRPLFRFALGYTMDGKVWAGPEIWAYSFEDAEARISAMRGSLTLVGQIVSRGDF